jgi:S-adenosylmethionine-dependent methyltransferase
MPGDHANPLQRRTAARTTVVWNGLRDALDVPGADDGLQVVDIGGGTGGFAVRVAELGHRVTVVDPSPDALAILGRRAEESGVADRVRAVQGDLDTLPDVVPAGSADAVLCHGVLEIVDDPARALEAIGAALRPGGVLSLLVNQRHAAVVARAMAGHFGQARDLLDAAPGSAPDHPHRFTVDELAALLDRTGFATTATHAVRVFVDLVPSSLVDLEPGAADRLVELELAVAERPEYLTLATQVHTLATRR